MLDFKDIIKLMIANIFSIVLSFIIILLLLYFTIKILSDDAVNFSRKDKNKIDTVYLYKHNNK